jgi:hypothetical protein
MDPASSSSSSSGSIALFAVASLLLTFFVALNAMSVRDQARTRDVASSFATRSQLEPGPVTIISIPGDAPAVKIVERRWLDLFPGAGLRQGQAFGAGQSLSAELGVAGIFAPGLADPLPSAIPVLSALSRIVGDAPSDLDVSLDVKLGLGAADQADGGKLAIQRARTLARVLGLAIPGGGDVAVGLQRGQPGVIALELRLANRSIPAQPMMAQPRAARPGA